MTAINDKVYNIKHEGETVIICGSAPCLIKEFEEVRKHRPAAKVMAINEAVAGVYADFLVSYHAEKFSYFKSLSLNKEVPTHTGKSRREEEEKLVDYYWSEIWIGATSAGDAIQIALKMNFAEIIMVGCPMNGGDGYFRKTDTGGICPRFGAPATLLGENADMVQVHKNKLLILKSKFDFLRVKSMSGFTAQVFGKPQWS